MISRLRHDWLAWLLTLGALLTLVGPLGLLRELGQPFGGYITYHRGGTLFNEIDSNTPSWWSGLLPGRTNHGDRLISVDGSPHNTGARAAYDQAAAAGSPTAQLQVERDESLVTVVLPVQVFTWLHFLDVRMPDLITGLVLWLAAVIVYLARPDRPANRAFALASTVAGYGRLLYVHTLFFDDALAIGTELYLQMWLAFLGPAILLLAASYPHYTHRQAVRTLLVLFVVGAIVACVCAILSRVEALPLSTRAAAERIDYYLILGMLNLGLLALFVRLSYSFINARSSQRDRRIAAILLISWTLALPPIIASGLNAVGIGDGSSYYFFYGLDLRYLLLFAPLGFAYVLVRYHAMQAPSPLFVFLMVITTSALAAALVAWAWTLTHQGWPEDRLQPPFVSLFIAALSIGLFWTTYAKLPNVLGRSLAWDRYSSTSAKEFGRRINDTMDLNHTPESIAQAIVDEFELEQCAVWLAEPDNSVMTLAARAGRRMTSLPASVDMSGRSLHSIHYPFRPADVAEGLPWAPDSPEAQHTEVIVPLAVDSRLLGVLGLGHRWDEDVFDSRNLEIFEIIGQQTTLLLAVSQHIRELQRVPGRLADAQEHERLRMAQELHDTIQQFLGRLPFYLAVSRDSITTDPAQAVELLDQSILDVEEAAQAVRQIRHNLAPSQLEGGLANSLVSLTTTFQRRTGLSTSLTCTPEVDASTNLAARHAIYRVIQQALDNVEVHANASAVDVRLTTADGFIRFTVSDNGRGSTPAKQLEAKRRGSFGIESMSTRLVAGGGGLQVVTAPNQGFEIIGWLPVTAPDPKVGRDIISSNLANESDGLSWSSAEPLAEAAGGFSQDA